MTQKHVVGRSHFLVFRILTDNTEKLDFENESYQVQGVQRKESHKIFASNVSIKT